jgi:hypothetical protein
LKIGEIGDMDMEDANGIWVNARSFVKLSQGNDTVQEVVLYQYEDYDRDYKIMRVLGEGFGKLESLRVLTIHYFDDDRRHNDGARTAANSLYWQAFAGALGCVRRRIELRINGQIGEDQDFIGLVMSALASLPSLPSLTLGYFNFSAIGSELKNLLKSPSLRSIEFFESKIDSNIGYALRDAFDEGSFITTLHFTGCYWYDEDHDTAGTIRALVQALQRPSSVKTLYLGGNRFYRLFCDGITSALLVNTTLLDLTMKVELGSEEPGRWLQPLFTAMRVNASLKSLDVNDFHLTDELVCRALCDMLAQNSVLESLTLHSLRNLDETDVVSWRNTLLSVRDNESLKSLTISFRRDALDPHVATICLDTVAILEGSTTLEYLNIKSGGISPDSYFAALEGFQPNTTLKTLRLSPLLASMGDDKMDQVVSFAKKHYSLEVLDDCVSAHDKTGEVGTLLRLNQAGRHYLIVDKASIAKGVEVLIGVSDDLGCLFYHLLENPMLCYIEY